MLVEAGRRFMDLGETGVTPVVSDARLFLSSSPASYDFIMVDAFRDNQVIPFHLASREFFGLIADRLRPGGGMMLNLSAAPGDEELGALLKRTVAAVFPHVYVLRAYPFNELIYAFREPPHWDHLGEGAPAALHDLLQSYLKYTSELSLPKGEVATDDRSRVEILSARVVSH